VIIFDENEQATRTSPPAVLSWRQSDAAMGLLAAWKRNKGRLGESRTIGRGKLDPVEDDRGEGSMYRSVTESRQNKSEKRKTFYWLEGVIFASALLIGVILLLGLTV
jgi:hypothetical protein